MDWSKKAAEIKAKFGDGPAKHSAAAFAHVQKKYRLARPMQLENDRVARGALSDGEMIEICISSGFDSTDFSGLLDRMTADYYAKLEELCG